MPCSVEGCGQGGRLTVGLCNKHYMRKLRTGSPHTVRKPGIVGQGRAKHFMYPAWQQMILRCHDPKNSVYPRYGAKGIRVCDRWRKDFLNFLADMGERPKGMTLDRINPYGNYEPDNCRWADGHTQRVNRTVEGDRANREAMSRGVKASWARRRAQ
jgi:hypothetical protein